MIKIEVKSTETTTKSGTSGKTGKPYSIREQVACYAFLTDRKRQPNAYPTRINVTLEDGQPPYEPGVYTIAEESLYADRFGSCH